MFENEGGTNDIVLNSTTNVEIGTFKSHNNESVFIPEEIDLEEADTLEDIECSKSNSTNKKTISPKSNQLRWVRYHKVLNLQKA